MNHCIFMTFDDNYFKYVKVCLNSIQSNYPDHPLILVYYTGNDDSINSFILLMPILRETFLSIAHKAGHLA